jgi:AcrR family transcriptional regulator
LRKDARQRREQLLRAAVELFTSDGVDVPLEKVADRAGVGRGTLYRNFPDRTALSIAVQDLRLADLARQVAGWADRDDAFLLALRAIARLTLSANGLQKLGPLERLSPREAERFRTRIEVLLAEPLTRAQAAGLVRPDFAVADVHRAARMLAGGAMAGASEVSEIEIDRSLALLVGGLRPREAD